METHSHVRNAQLLSKHLQCPSHISFIQCPALEAWKYQSVSVLAEPSVEHSSKFERHWHDAMFFPLALHLDQQVVHVDFVSRQFKSLCEAKSRIQEQSD